MTNVIFQILFVLISMANNPHLDPCVNWTLPYGITECVSNSGDYYDEVIYGTGTNIYAIGTLYNDGRAVLSIAYDYDTQWTQTICLIPSRGCIGEGPQNIWPHSYINADFYQSITNR